MVILLYRDQMTLEQISRSHPLQGQTVIGLHGCEDSYNCQGLNGIHEHDMGILWFLTLSSVFLLGFIHHGSSMTKSPNEPMLFSMFCMFNSIQSYIGFSMINAR